MSITTHLVRGLGAAVVTVGLLATAACGGEAEPTTPDAPTALPDDGLIQVGFVAVGPEGAWRAANEASMQNTFTAEAGFELFYEPSINSDQKSQLDAFTAFVDQGVDVILLSATEGSGWEDSLERAQRKDIPVILIDRGIEPDNPELYVTRIAPDNAAVAKNVADWALEEFPDGATYFVLEGPAGVSVVNERNRGWDQVMVSHPEFVKVGAETANWSAVEGESVTAAALAAYPTISLIFAQNDEMGLGAIEAVKDVGLTPGVDVKIATIDGTRGAMDQLFLGNLSFVAEYSPLFGPTALDVVNKVLAGETVEKYIVVPSAAFDSISADDLAARQY